jgi:peptidyl-prolyl cis-trans isomerase NIMA-interacting 1
MATSQPFSAALRGLLFGASLAIATGCGGGSTTAPPAAAGQPDSEPVAAGVVSADILAREPVANRSKVKHILIGWKDKADAYGGGIDPRAKDRTQAQAEAIITDLMGKLRGGAAFEALMVDFSEDRVSAQSGNAFEVTPDAGLVLEFRQLGLRLELNEIGVVESQFGYHIVKRVF